jgi:hypothetical protein
MIRGRARAAVAVDVFNGRIPSNTAFVLNRFDDFDPQVAANGGVWLFSFIASKVVHGDALAFDRSVLLAMRRPGDR